MSYSAIVTKIKLKKHPNADKILLGEVVGHQVIVGLDCQEGELGVFFACDGQLSQEFAKANDLISRKDEVTGERRGGFFGESRKVRAQKFRGEKSDGFWCPLTFFKNVSGINSQTVDNLKEYDKFTELDGIEVCRKYETPATISARHNVQNHKARKKNIQFPEHFDTEQFKYSKNKVTDGSIIWITEKLHGSSGRYSHVQETNELKLPWYKKLLNKIGFKFVPETKTSWELLTGTRRVILKNPDQKGFYEDPSFRFKSLEHVMPNLRKGEILYLELVGYEHDVRPIMGAVSTDKLSDKSFQKKYGKTMIFKYGCPVGTCKPYAYRIANVNEDGHLVDMSWPMVKQRCLELGIDYVPELAGPILINNSGDLSFSGISVDELEIMLDNLVEGESTLDSSHIREGVCVRIENQWGTNCLKHKSFTFKVLEGIVKDNDSYVDTEEAQG